MTDQADQICTAVIRLPARHLIVFHRPGTSRVPSIDHAPWGQALLDALSAAGWSRTGPGELGRRRDGIADVIFWSYEKRATPAAAEAQIVSLAEALTDHPGVGVRLRFADGARRTLINNPPAAHNGEPVELAVSCLN